MTHQDLLKNLERRLKRLNTQLASMEAEYAGREADYTFHAGFANGHTAGKIAEIEGFMDYLIKMQQEEENT